MVDIELSKDEDSVSSLAVAYSTSSSLTAFAGVNSSQADQNAGKNEHLRSFRIEYPPRKKSKDGDAGDKSQEHKAQTMALGRAALFRTSTAAKKETYQRITRLSRPCKINGGQLGAIATGFSPEGEIVLFDVKTNGPMGPWVEARIPLGKGEAEDVDIAGLNDLEDLPPGTFSVVYCTAYEIYICRVTLKQKKALEPKMIYSEPHPETSARDKRRPKFRSLRFLTPQLLLVIQNSVDRKGAQLLLFELSPSSDTRIVAQKKLHKGINAATALSVAQLPPSSPNHPCQHVVAVAGQDTSLSILTLDHPQKPPFQSLRLRTHLVLHNVHPAQMTSLAFSAFSHPDTPYESTPPQYLKLASTSFKNTVIVHTFPLVASPPPLAKKPTVRYVLHPPGRSESVQFTFAVIISALVIAIGAFFLQAFTEIRGGSPEFLGAKGWLSQRVHDYIALPYMFENGTVSSLPTIAPSEPLNNAATIISSISGQASTSATDLNSEAHLGAVAAQNSGVDSSEQVKAAVSSALDRASEAASELLSAYFATSSTVSSASSSVSHAASRNLHLRGLLSRHFHHRHPATDSPSPHMIIRAEGGELKGSFHDPKAENKREVKKFEELDHAQREAWKKRLQEAGAWTVDEGEAVLKGVFFGGVAQAVGDAVRGAVA